LLTACGSEGSDGAVVEEGGVTTIKATHGTGLCNLTFFLAKEKAWSDTVDLEWVVAPTNADIVTLFGAGEVNVSLVPYTQFMTLTDKGADLKIIAGGGVQGCILVAQKGITSAEQLRGKSIGTFQADTLEVVPYNYLKEAGMSFKDVTMKYLGTSPELAEAFLSGAVDAISHIEPYASQAVAGRPGATVLTDGIDMYGAGYTDCVLAASSGAIEEHRDALKEVIRSMMLSQQLLEQKPDEAIALTAQKYFKTTEAVVAKSSSIQPCVVDQKDKQQFMLDRAADLKDMGYLGKVPGEEVFDWSLLDEVIEENAELYGSLERKRA